MNVHALPPTDPDAFLRWNEGREGFRELADGKVVEMMTGGTYGHARLMFRLALELHARLEPAGLEVATGDVGVKSGRSVRYPDVVVTRGGDDPRALAVVAPVLIAEVLSPSSMVIDFGAKVTEYAALPSLLCYLVLSADEPRAWLWLRQADGWTEPAMLEGGEAVLAVPPLGLELPLASLYPQPPAPAA